MTTRTARPARASTTTKLLFVGIFALALLGHLIGIKSISAMLLVNWLGAQLYTIFAPALLLLGVV